MRDKKRPLALIRKPRRRMSLARNATLLALIMPALAILALVIAYPLINGILLSLKNYNVLNPSTKGSWTGLHNYKAILSSKEFWSALRVTVFFAFGSVAGQYLVGFVLALLLNREMPGRAIFRGLGLVPWVVPTVVAALIWMLMYGPQYGVINYILLKIGVFHKYQSFLGTRNQALWALIFANIWKGCPFFMVMLLAGLQTIPSEIIDASKIDGADVFARFRYITLPYLRSITMISTLIGIIWTFQNFTLIWVTTKGGPLDSTTTLSVRVFRTAFEGFDMAKGATIGILWLLFLAIFAFIYSRVFAFRRG